MMIERLYFTTLVRGMSELRANPLRLERFFLSQGLELSEVRSIREWFDAAQPSVNQAFPRHGVSRFPGVFIVLDEESEQQKFLDDSAGNLTMSEALDLGYADLVGVDVKSSIYQYKHHLLIVADNPDKCLYLYHIVRYLMMRHRDELERGGLLYTHYSGSDAYPDADYLPETFFVRRFSIRALAQSQAYNESARLGLVSSVGEISIESGSVTVSGVDNG